MDLATGYKAIDYVFYLSQGAKMINLVFTGGEPLLVTPLLRKLIKHAIDESEKYDYNLSFHIKTNGSIVNPEIIKLAHDNGVSFVVSIDGRDSTHNKKRVTSNRSVTHQLAVSNLKILLDNRIDCSCSVTVDPQCANDVIENVEYLVDIGIKDFSIGPVYGTVKWKETQIMAFNNALKGLHKRYDGHSNTNEVFIKPIHNCQIHKNEFLVDTWGCEALHSNIAILPTGEICGCSALAYLSIKYPYLIVGDVHNGLNSKAEKYLLEIIDAGIEPRTQCKNCSSKNNCYGGCYAINISCNGSPYLPPPIYCNSIEVLSGMD